VVDRVLSVALDQRGGDLRRLIEPLRVQVHNHQRGSGHWRPRLGAEHLFQRGEPLLALPNIDLRYADLRLDGWILGIESGGFLELLQGEIRLVVRHIGASQYGQCRRIRRGFVGERFEVFDGPRCRLLL
jgi:hypothetical protein